MRNFLWFANPERLRSNLVRWETVYLPRSEGGLSLRRVNEFNEARLLNLAWSTITADSLWANWFGARYFRGPSIWHFLNPRGGSCIWKRLRSFSSLIQRDSRWVVGNGRSISLWFDKWIDHDPITPRFPSIQFSELDLVADIIVDNAWYIPIQLPIQLQEFLALSTNPIPIGDSTAPDSLSWDGSTTCNFSLREAWNLLRTKAAETTWYGLNWNKFINPRLACLSWRLMHRKTPTNFWAKQRGWSLASRCYNCLCGEESDLHLFFSCNLANQLWHRLPSPYGVQPSSPFSASAICTTLATDRDVLGRKFAASIFFHAIFVLWSLRNDSKHNSRKPSLERAKLIFMDRLKWQVRSQVWFRISVCTLSWLFLG